MEVEYAAQLTEEEKAEVHPGVDAARLDKFLARIPATSRKHALRLIGFEAGPDDTEEDVRKVVERWWTAKHNLTFEHRGRTYVLTKRRRHQWWTEIRLVSHDGSEYIIGREEGPR